MGGMPPQKFWTLPHLALTLTLTETLTETDKGVPGRTIFFSTLVIDIFVLIRRPHVTQLLMASLADPLDCPKVGLVSIIDR